MTTGQSDDGEETQKQISNPTPIINGKTWLRHRENTQAGLIDQMLFEGTHSIEEIAMELNKRFTPQQSLKERVIRVKDHISHLQDGNSRGKASGMKPHRLRLIEEKGKWKFDV